MKIIEKKVIRTVSNLVAKTCVIARIKTFFYLFCRRVHGLYKYQLHRIKSIVCVIESTDKVENFEKKIVIYNGKAERTILF